MFYNIAINKALHQYTVSYSIWYYSENMILSDKNTTIRRNLCEIVSKNIITSYNKLNCCGIGE